LAGEKLLWPYVENRKVFDGVPFPYSLHACVRKKKGSKDYNEYKLVKLSRTGSRPRREEVGRFQSNGDMSGACPERDLEG